MQTAPFWHGFGLHSSMLVSQFAPEKPAGQLHVYALTPSAQVPPFWHGFDAQSSMLVWQVVPEKPGAH